MPSASHGKTRLPSWRIAAALIAPLLLGVATDDACADLADAASPTLEITSTAREGGLCRVEAVARPRPNAAIGISLWLPPASRWSGRYYQMGNGGFAGSIDRKTLAAAAARGDAAAATDTGHTGTGFDAGWARGRPDLITDYAWRSIKLTSDAARDLLGRYYGRPARRHYFMGCSFGGRQALVAASRWPGEWDGIIVGAPAVEWIDWLTAFARIQHELRYAPGAWLTPNRLSQAQTRRDVLIPAQHHALTTIERAGYPLVDANLDEWRRWIVNPDPSEPSQARLATEAFRYLFADRPDWTLADYHPSDAPPASLRDEFAVGSLERFAFRGGRIFTYVGTADAVLSPSGIVSALQRRLSQRARSVAFRLLSVPGMAHCQGGAAFDAFGQSIVAPAMRDDPKHDIRRAVENWVELKKAPMAMVVSDRDRRSAGRLVRLLP